MISSRYALIVITALLLLACNDDENTPCGVQDPLHELSWLKAEIEAVEAADYSYDYIIYQGLYDHQPVFISSICCPFCMTTPPVVKTCSGRTLGYLGVDVDDGILKHAKVIWRTDNGVCP